MSRIAEWLQQGDWTYHKKSIWDRKWTLEKQNLWNTVKSSQWDKLNTGQRSLKIIYRPGVYLDEALIKNSYPSQKYLNENKGFLVEASRYRVSGQEERHHPQLL